MDAKGKKRIVIWVSVAALLGVGGYFAYKFVKAKRDKKKAEQDAASTPSTSTSSSNSAPSSTPLIPNPFNTKAELEKFQNWVLTMYPFDRAILGRAGADGIWGKNSANAWLKYGDAYKTRMGAITSANTFGLGSLIR